MGLWYILPVKEGLWYILPVHRGLWYILPVKEGLWYILPVKEGLWYILPVNRGLWYILPVKEGLWYILPVMEGLWYILPGKGGCGIFFQFGWNPDSVRFNPRYSPLSTSSFSIRFLSLQATLCNWILRSCKFGGLKLHKKTETLEPMLWNLCYSSWW